MRVVILTGAVALAALSLAACNRKPAEPAASGAEPAATAAPAAATAASGPTALPRRKPGLWRTSITTEGGPAGARGHSSDMCIDEAVEEKLTVVGGQTGREACKTYDFNRNLDGSFSFHSVCDMGPSGTIDSSGSITGDFNSAYKVSLKSTTSGASVAQMNGSHVMTVDSQRLGPCKSGQRGGDMVLSNGMTMNVIDMMNARKGGAPMPMPARP